MEIAKKTHVYVRVSIIFTNLLTTCIKVFIKKVSYHVITHRTTLRPDEESCIPFYSVGLYNACNQSFHKISSNLVYISTQCFQV